MLINRRIDPINNIFSVVKFTIGEDTESAVAEALLYLVINCYREDLKEK